MKRVLYSVLGVAALLLLAALVWQGLTAGGAPDPTAAGLTPAAAILSTGLIVFREGLEAILVIAALTASFAQSKNRQGQQYQRSIALGSGAALLASVATWFVAVAVISSVNAPALHIQAVTGLLAIVVLLVIMNWFFHKVYWTGWISMHNKRRRRLMEEADDNRSRALMGMALLGFSAVYREGFEVVLFLQSLRLRAGTSVVMEGVLIGLAFTAVAGVLTFVAHHRLPHKKMLVFTGVMLAGVLVVMVGESAEELQLAGWISRTPVTLPIPDWMGMWFAVFPNVESLAAQAFAALLVGGSYFVSRYVKVWRPSKRNEKRSPAHALGRQQHSRA